MRRRVNLLPYFEAVPIVSQLLYVAGNIAEGADVAEVGEVVRLARQDKRPGEGAVCSVVLSGEADGWL